jgi:hypothetical protein
VDAGVLSVPSCSSPTGCEMPLLVRILILEDMSKGIAQSLIEGHDEGSLEGNQLENGFPELQEKGFSTVLPLHHLIRDTWDGLILANQGI